MMERDRKIYLVLVDYGSWVAACPVPILVPCGPPSGDLDRFCGGVQTSLSTSLLLYTTSPCVVCYVLPISKVATLPFISPQPSEHSPPPVTH